MNDLNYYYVRQYHQRLIQIAQQSGGLKSLRKDSPSLLDHVLLIAGNLLVAWGERLRRGSVLARASKLSEECV